MKVYAYEVTHSNVPTVAVGTCLIERLGDHDEVRQWELYDTTTGGLMVGWSGRRRERLCLACYQAPAPAARVHGHEGGHGASGTAERYDPAWMLRAALTGERGGKDE